MDVDVYLMYRLKVPSLFGEDGVQGAALAPLAAVPLVLGHLPFVRVALDAPLPLLVLLLLLVGLLGDEFRIILADGIGIGISLGRGDKVQHRGSPVVVVATNVFQGSIAIWLGIY